MSSYLYYGPPNFQPLNLCDVTIRQSKLAFELYKKAEIF